MSTMVPMYGFGGFGGGGGTGATLTVTAPAACRVTVSKDGKSKTKVADASGVAVFNGLSTGEWTITMTDGTQTSAPKTVTITADYSTAMSFFAATINITYPAGSTCTATDGVTTLTAPDTSGTWECVVPNVGTWTVTVVDKGWSDTAEVTENGQTVEVLLNFVCLYSIGNMHTELGGNWTTTGYSRAGWGNFTNVSPTNTDNGLHVSTGSQISVFGKENEVDFTKYSRLVIKVAAIDNSISEFFIAGTKSLVQESNSVAYKNITGQTGEISVDVSGINGSYYPMFAFYNGTCLIEEVRLEP